ncbi:MAG: thioredoxin-disulfide reductase [Patescibacteria group bacterium]|nr:thioredoxin-disulfide reductase [Patescibacteria group bacterium]
MTLKDVLIIGGGIAGNTAALYTARASLEPTVFVGLNPDQLSLTAMVENFPGFINGVLGPELVGNAKKQAEKFGATYINENVESFEINDGAFTIITADKTYQSRTVIIATGASARFLGVKGESDYIGKGVSTCATCDAAFYRDREVVVIGGGDSAMEDSSVLYKFAKKITIIHRRNEFKASKIMQDRIFGLKDKIGIVWNSAVEEIIGNGQFVTGIKIKNVETGELSELKTDGVFLAIGHDANTKLFAGKVELDQQNYIITDKRARTSVPGIFAAGDVADPTFRQAITSAGTGCAAAMEAEKYIENLKANKKY